MRYLSTGLGLLLITVLLWSMAPTDTQAQDRPRFGVGFNSFVSTQDGFGPGIRFRVSSPINQDLSIGVGSGFTGFVLGGREDASYAFDPQISLIVTRTDTPTQGTYFLGGFGAYLPIDTGSASAPTIHAGAGRVWLLQETSLFAEFNPALVIGEESAHGLFSFRFGIIF